MLIATRAMFAWSFDRLVPEKLSEVHPKYNSPWVAVLVVAVIAEAFLFLYHIEVFKFLTPALAYYFVFWLVSLCGVLFPFLAADPAAARGEPGQLADRRASRSCRSAACSGCSTSRSGCTSC